MQSQHSPLFLAVRSAIADTLGLGPARVAGLTPDTALFGGIPELDSFAVVQLAMTLEETFGFQIDDSAFTADVFDTIGSLCAFVEASGGRAEPRTALSDTAA